MKILIVSYHFYPEMAVGAKRMSELALFLSEKGCEVTVFSSSVDNESDEDLENKVKDISIVRIKAPPKITPILIAIKEKIARVLNNNKHGESEYGIKDSQSSINNVENEASKVKRFYHSMEWLFDDKKLWSSILLFRLLGHRILNSYDLIVSSGPPMSPHISILTGNLFSKTKWIMDLRDPWVGNQSWPNSVNSKSRELIESYFEECCFRNADYIVTASPGIKKSIQKYANKVEVVLNGYDEQPFILNPAPTNKLHLLYAGSIYFNRNPFPLFEAIKSLINHSHVDATTVKLVLVGNCISWNGVSLDEWVQENKMSDSIEIHPPVMPSQLYDYFNDANVLINFAQGQPNQIPAKVYEYIASNRETLLLTENGSDCSKIVNDSKSGRVIYSSDVNDLVSELLSLYEYYVTNGTEYTCDPKLIKKYARVSQNLKYQRLIESL